MTTQAFSANGFAATEKGSRYLAQLCKHWEHNLAVTHQDDRGTIVFPKDARGADWPGDATVTIDARVEGLAIHIDASAHDQCEGLKDAVARHIDRFAFREAPLDYRWE